MSKPLFIAVFHFLLFLQADKKPESTVVLNQHFEVLKGRVKQVVQTGLSLRGTPFVMHYSDTLLFDKNGNERGIHSGWPDGLFISTFIEKYSNGEKQIVWAYPRSDGRTIFKYGKEQRLVQTIDCYQNTAQEQNDYSYDLLGRVSQRDTYVKRNGTHYKTTYSYNDKGYLIAEYYIPPNEKNYPAKSETGYKYLSFDEKGNWTTQVTIGKTAAPIDTIRRKINYY